MAAPPPSPAALWDALRAVVEVLVKAGRKEAVTHAREVRPWGGFTVLHEGPGFKVKEVVVDPRGRLTLSFTDPTNGRHTAPWRVVTLDPAADDSPPPLAPQAWRERGDHLGEVMDSAMPEMQTLHRQLDDPHALMPLNQLAGITTPDARMIVIQPYDKSTIKAIEKAIQNSELGINPSNDGVVIRLSVPPLTSVGPLSLLSLLLALLLLLLLLLAPDSVPAPPGSRGGSQTPTPNAPRIRSERRAPRSTAPLPSAAPWHSGNSRCRTSNTWHGQPTPR